MAKNFTIQRKHTLPINLDFVRVFPGSRHRWAQFREPNVTYYSRSEEMPATIAAPGRVIKVIIPYLNFVKTFMSACASASGSACGREGVPSYTAHLSQYGNSKGENGC
jgi:hypothetical protein